MTKKRVLVTGIAGTIGGIVRDYLRDDYELSGLDRVAIYDVPTHIGDLADFDSIRPAFDGQDVVVHLGGDPRGQAPWESVLQNNIVGTQNVFEACRQAGVGRVVFASTNHVVGYIPETQEPYKAVFDGRFDEV
jgi:nucleoside-diphosphate-sugar epimerase